MEYWSFPRKTSLSRRARACRRGDRGTHHLRHRREVVCVIFKTRARTHHPWDFALRLTFMALSSLEIWYLIVDRGIDARLTGCEASIVGHYW